MYRGAPLPPYIKEQGGFGRPRGRGAPGGVLLLPGVGLPPFPCWTRRERGKRWRGGRKGGRRPPLLVLFGLGGGACGPALASSPLFHLGPLRPIKLPGGPVTSRYSGKIPISPGTLPISKHRLPIYQSLCLDHFETPHHVCDHIRESELSSVHQNT